MFYVHINVRENRRDNQTWTIQRNRQYWVHKTQVEDKQNLKQSPLTIRKQTHNVGIERNKHNIHKHVQT